MGRAMTDYVDPLFDTGTPLRRPSLEPAEEDALAAQVNKDIAEGKGHRHFEDVFDELHSTQKPATNEPDAGDRDEMETFERAIMWQLKRDVTSALLNHGMRCVRVADDRAAKGYRAELTDREGRSFEAVVTFNEANLPPDVDGRAVFKLMVDSLVERALGARAHYFERMCLEVKDDAGNGASKPDETVAAVATESET